MDGDNVHLPNVTPDDGLSAPFNSWFTFFGQFFDHGLDLVTKGGSGTVFIPLQPDDPLYVAGQPDQLHGADARHRISPAPTASSAPPTTSTSRPTRRRRSSTRTRPTPRIPRTRCSCASTCSTRTTASRDRDRHGCIDGTRRRVGGMATWARGQGPGARHARHQADRRRRRQRAAAARPTPTATSSPAPNGFPQVIIGVGVDGIANTADDVVAGNRDPRPAPTRRSAADRRPHRPRLPQRHRPRRRPDRHDRRRRHRRSDSTTPAMPQTAGTYDNELLDAHFIAGDGRGNENIGLTAVHHVFHSEHNRLVEQTKDVVLADAAISPSSTSGWRRRRGRCRRPAGTAIDALRLERRAPVPGRQVRHRDAVPAPRVRGVRPQDPAAHRLVPRARWLRHRPSTRRSSPSSPTSVYRFGHSMLTETDRPASIPIVHRTTSIGLIEAFLNPLAFAGQRRRRR